MDYDKDNCNTVHVFRLRSLSASTVCVLIFLGPSTSRKYNGLDKTSIDPEIKDIAFPNIHSMKRESVAKHLTQAIRDIIDVSGPTKDKAKKRKTLLLLAFYASRIYDQK